MIVLTCEDHGCAYSIDSEGTLYYSPLMVGGGLETEDWSEVDHMAMLGEECEYKTIVDTIHEQLIAMSKLIGEYYQA